MPTVRMARTDRGWFVELPHDDRDGPATYWRWFASPELTETKARVTLRANLSRKGRGWRVNAVTMPKGAHWVLAPDLLFPSDQ